MENIIFKMVYKWLKTERSTMMGIGGITRILLVMGLLFGLVCPVQAAETGSDDFASLEDMLFMDVVTASKKAESLMVASASMYVITDKQIKERGYNDLEEILRDVPGFDFNREFSTSGTQNYSTIYMRGFRSTNSERFILIYDGIQENDIWKQTSWIDRQYPVSQIKRIEVLYGPASALYGTSAFSGIVNIITKQQDEVGTLNAKADYGSYGRKDIEISSGNKKDGVGYNFTIKSFSADKYPSESMWARPVVAFTPPPGFTPPRGGGAFGGTTLASKQYADLGFHGNLYFGDLKLTALNWTRHDENTAFNQHNQGYSATHNLKINDKTSLESKMQHRKHDFLLAENMNYMVWDRGIEEQLNYTISEKWDIIAGVLYDYIDTQEDYNGSMTGTTTSSPRHRLNKTGALLQTTFEPVNKLRVIAGGRYEDTKDENKGGYNIFVPRVSFVYSYLEDLVFRLQYSEAYQEASDWQKYSLGGMRANPNLKPERLKSYEFGTTAKLGKTKLGAAVYQNYVEDLIEQVGGTTMGTFQNVGEAEISGYEVTWDVPFSEKLTISSGISGAFNEDASGEEIGNMAPVKFNLFTTYKITQKLSLFSKLNYVSKKDTISTNTQEPEIDGHAIVGLNLQYKITQDFSAHVKVDNLFNTKYYEGGPRDANGTNYPARVQQPGRNIMVGGGCSF